MKKTLVKPPSPQREHPALKSISLLYSFHRGHIDLPGSGFTDLIESGSGLDPQHRTGEVAGFGRLRWPFLNSFSLSIFSVSEPDSIGSVDPVPDPDRESGAGFRKTKIPHKQKQEKVKKFHVLKYRSEVNFF
jgi:hypothetical protein